MCVKFSEAVIILEVTEGSYMNTIGLIESTRVSAFQWYHIYADPTLFRDPGVQKHHFKLRENNTFVLHAENCLVFAL